MAYFSSNTDFFRLFTHSDVMFILSKKTILTL